MLFLLLLLWQAPIPTCQDVDACRAQAQEAFARGDFEVFHDLAWRVVQKGKPNDPDLMLLLARAMSLSGRPNDALVMLGRIADPARAQEALTGDDFRTVRLMAGWPALEARLTGAPAPAAPPAPAPPPAAAPGAAPAPPSAPPRSMPSPSAPAPVTPAPSAASAPRPPVFSSEDALTFAAPDLDPSGLAHDAVSRRFVVGDRRARRLLVIDEVSRHVVNYVSAGSAGFYENLTAFTIDARRGDLWVVSAKGETDQAASVLHKLQLVSGRALLEVRTAADMPVRFVDVTVTPDGTVYALDSIDSQIFRLRPGSRALELAMRLDARRPTALTAADDRVLYVAADTGLFRVDLAARVTSPVKSAEALTDFESLSWRANTLIGIERVAGSSLVVRLALDPAGLRAQPRHILAASPQATVGVLAGDSYFFVASPGVIRRLRLK